MFCFPELIFGGTVGVGSRFHVLRSRTSLRRYRRRRVSFTCIALPDMFSAVRRASDIVFMFCSPGLVLGGSEGVGSRFHLLRPVLIFDGTEGVESRFHVLRSRTHFRRYRGHRLLFSCYTLPESFSAVLRASSPVFIFCAPGIIFGGNEGVGS
jgi:hypothetical protein